MNPGAMDPMANLSSPNPNGADPAAAGTGGEGNDVYDLKALTVNASQSDRIHSYMGIVSGCVAGILGLLNWQGIGTFYISSPSRRTTSCHFFFSLLFWIFCPFLQDFSC